ncbi:MAG: aminotransferase class III-fold pyridoxal phosphate-dependent enzyme, partial [Anaerolineales bacterium]
FGVIYDERLNGFAPGDHSFTFAHFPVSMTAALATIEVIEEENLFENVRKIGEFFAKRLDELKQTYELIGDVRAIGLMIGVELVKDRVTKEPARKEAERFVAEGLKRGVIFGESRYLGLGNIIKIKPPLNITQSEAEQVMTVFEDILSTLQ